MRSILIVAYSLLTVSLRFKCAAASDHPGEMIRSEYSMGTLISNQQTSQGSSMIEDPYMVHTPSGPPSTDQVSETKPPAAGSMLRTPESDVASTACGEEGQVRRPTQI